MPRKPSDAISRISSDGTLPCSSISCARGSTFSRAKSRAVRCASSCSSLSARSNPVVGSVRVTVSTVLVISVLVPSVLLVGIEAHVTPVGIAREEVIAAELAHDRAGGLRARERGADAVDAEPNDEAALPADFGLGLPVFRLVDDELRVRRVKPGRVVARLAGQSDDLAVEARDLRVLLAEGEDRSEHGAVLLAHAQTVSTASATASPPPRHSEAMPRRFPRARSA